MTYYRRTTTGRRLADIILMLMIFSGLVYGLRNFGVFDLEPGNATIIDGDSLRIKATEIRLHGIDAPEYRQSCRDNRNATYPCGQQAADALRGLVRGQTVKCRSLQNDRYGRAVSDCDVGVININGEMVRLGWALAYRQHSLAHITAEQDAKRAKRGIWSGNFERPEDYRRRNQPKQSDLTSTPTPAD